MSDDRDIIDVEAVEIFESDNLPAVIERKTHDPAPSIEGRDWSTYSRPERRCTAHSSRTGEPCKNAAILGHNVCRYHGGAAKQIKQAARTRLENAADLMAKQLLGIALTADSDGVKLAAIRDALDRAGLKAPSEVVLSQGEPKAYETVFDSIGGYPSDSYDLAGVSPAEHENPSLATTQPAAGYPTGEPASAGEHPPGQPTPRDHPVDAAVVGGEYTDESSGHESPGQGQARQRDREKQPQARELHITGEDAMRLANQANRAIGAMPDQLALESRHKRYPRP